MGSRSLRRLMIFLPGNWTVGDMAEVGFMPQLDALLHADNFPNLQELYFDYNPGPRGAVHDAPKSLNALLPFFGSLTDRGVKVAVVDKRGAARLADCWEREAVAAHSNR